MTTPETTFLNWLKSNGATVTPKLDLVYDATTNQRRVIAKEAFEENEKLFTLPRTLLLTPEQSSIGSLLIKHKKKLSGWLPLIIALMHEFNNPTSFWRPYLDLLPQSLDTPMFWSNEDLAYLEGTRTLALLGKEDAETLYRDSLVPFIKLCSPQLKLTDFTLELFHRSASLIMAYSFQDEEEEEEEDEDDDEDDEENEDDEDDDEDEDEEETTDSNSPKKSVFQNIAMVPLADMLNHKTGYNNARLFYGKENLSMSCIKPCKEGDELYNTYGDLPNSQLLRKYGFVDEVNAFNSVEIPEEYLLEKFESRINQNEQLVDFLSFANMWQPEFIITEGLTCRELEGAIAFLQTKSAFKEFEKEPDEEKLSLAFSTLITKTRRSTLPVLLEFAKKRLSQYPTKLEEDEQLVASNPELSEHQRLALQVRMEEKRILVNYIKQLEEQSIETTANSTSSSTSNESGGRKKPRRK